MTTLRTEERVLCLVLSRELSHPASRAHCREGRDVRSQATRLGDSQALTQARGLTESTVSQVTRRRAAVTRTQLLTFPSPPGHV